MLNDDQVRAELERIDNTVLNLWDQYLGVHDDTSRYVRLGPLRKALRLLAMSQDALGEIKKRIELILKIFPMESVSKRDLFPKIEDIGKIAGNAVKGGK